MTTRLSLGMVGGGQGAFIGAVHRMAAALDGQYDLVCGAFSRDITNTLATGKELGLDPKNCFRNYSDLIASHSSNQETGGGLDVLSIVTPNSTHVPIAREAAASGIHVMSDKPAGISLAEVRELAKVLEQTDAQYGLTHTYLGYPMVWQARHLASQPSFGAIRKVIVQYRQGWLASQLENADNKQANWRTDPAVSGPAGALGDIGSHAHSLAEFVTNSRMDKLSARLRSHFSDRLVDDDNEISFTLENGASGVLISSQICSGEENGLSIQIYGENGALEWRQMEPNSLIKRRANEAFRVHRAGVDQPLCTEALARCRLPAGHPEGYLEALANLYKFYAASLRLGEAPSRHGVPGIAEALRGMAFLEAAISSSAEDGRWTTVEAPDVGPDRKGLLA